PPDSTPPDQGPPPPDMGPTLCEAACARFAACSITECDGFGPGDSAALTTGCLPVCDANPAFGTVVNGADGCGTIIAFGRDQGDARYNEACGDAPPPLEPDGGECPYPCVGDEVCVGGQCVRPDGTCDTDYHCRIGVEQCQDGTCRTAQFAECRAEADCTGADQSCYSFSPDPLAPGNCFIGCETDDACPPSETCNAQAGVCYYVFCGPGSPNGDVFGACDVGARGGTCYPLPEGNANAQGTPGICLEADGDAPLGAPCDAQATARTPENRAVQCAAGGICFGDPDDPREPGAVLDGQGTCNALCDPRAPACPEGTACLDFTTPDDPATPGFDDTRYIGACLPSDCDVLAADDPCGEGRGCRPYAVTTTAGLCVDTGEVGAGEACAENDDCAGAAICGNNGVLEQACLPICDPDAEGACGDGQACFAQPGWLIGFCVPAP
ncbi:MAG: hypothetical protein KC549_07070, partial [Myxococcales bacterium]|nr:hypothetical protein [Myxococcales bacterium]